MGLFGNFGSRQILKQNMLESLRDYPREFLQTFYSDYGIGLVSGFNISVDNANKKIIIQPGIAKFTNGIFFSTQCIQLDLVYNKNQYLFLKVVEENTVEGVNQKVECISSDDYKCSDGIFLCRYLLGQQAMLNVIDDSFTSNPEMSNIVDNIQSPKSVKGGSTVCDNLFNYYANKVLQSNDAKNKDICLAYQILNGVSSIDIVKQYFAECEDLSNDALWEYILNKQFKKEEVIVTPKSKNDTRILVDCS